MKARVLNFELQFFFSEGGAQSMDTSNFVYIKITACGMGTERNSE